MQSCTREVRRTSRYSSFCKLVTRTPEATNSSAAVFFRANVRMVAVGRETARLMPPISSRPDMNSRATRPRSHRSRIRSREAVSNRDGVIEGADQGKQSSIGHRFIPVIENCAKRWLALHGADDGDHPN